MESLRSPHSWELGEINGGNIKNNIAIILSVIATGTGSFGAYTAHQANLEKQPLDKHQQVAMSFKDQISTARDRGDKTNANAVSEKYGEYEESWRAIQLLASVTASIRSLDLEIITKEKRTEIASVLDQVTKVNWVSSESPEAFGAAYFAIGNYEKATEEFGIALAADPDNNNLKVLKAVSLISTVGVSNTKLDSLRSQATELFGGKNMLLTEKQKNFLINTNSESLLMPINR